MWKKKWGWVVTVENNYHSHSHGMQDTHLMNFLFSFTLEIVAFYFSEHLRWAFVLNFFVVVIKKIN